MFGRNKVAMLVAEFLGTAILSLVAVTLLRSQLASAGTYFVSIALGVVVLVVSLVFGGISGAHLNPAVTIGMWTVRKIKTLPAITYLVAQLLGGWAAFGVYQYFTSQTIQKVAGHFTARMMLAEALGSFVFVLAWAAVAAQKQSAAIVGAAFTVGIMVAGVASFGIINPSIALAIRTWTVGFHGSVGWLTYLVGPILGGVVAYNLYQLLFAGHVVTEKVIAAETVAVKKTEKAIVAKKVVAKKPAAKKAKR